MEPSDIRNLRAALSHQRMLGSRKNDIVGAVLDKWEGESDIYVAQRSPDRFDQRSRLGIGVPISQDEWDHASVVCDELFRRRFRCDWPPRDRVQLINLKNAFNLTDREVRLLRRLGSIRRINGRLQFQPNFWVFVTGRT